MTFSPSLRESDILTFNFSENMTFNMLSDYYFIYVDSMINIFLLFMKLQINKYI